MIICIVIPNSVSLQQREKFVAQFQHTHVRKRKQCKMENISMNSSNDYDKFEEDDFSYEWVLTLEFIGRDVLEPTFSCAGVVLNVLVFCIWMFGTKSKSLCCATYFSANAVADFLLLLLLPIIGGTWIISIPWRKTDFTCKLTRSLYHISTQVSTWLSATITVERALTIMLPFVFKSQDMSGRSKYIIAIIIVMQPLTQIFTLLYCKGITESVTNEDYCIYNSTDEFRIVESVHMCLAIAIPFLVIVTFNLAIITVLCRNRFQQHTVSGNRDYIQVFTKITIMTGVSFVLSYSLELCFGIYVIFLFKIDNIFLMATFLTTAMVYFNSCMNPIICLVVCKSMHDDIKSFLMAVLRRVRRPCASRCWHQESETANAFPMATMV